jgi:prefoldin subunit 5
MISRPHELAEVSEVIIEPGVGYFVRGAIHDDDWVLRIGVGIPVDN